MAVARGVGSPEPAPPLLYKWGGLRLGEPGCALERRGTAIRGGPKEQGRLSHPPSPNAFPEVRAQSQEPGLLGLQGAGCPDYRPPRHPRTIRAQRARPPEPRSRRRAMLHFSEFSGPDALLVKSTEGCCSEPNTELPRLSTRDPTAASGYPGGKERGRGCSDDGAARGHTVPENRQGLGHRSYGGKGHRRFGVLWCAPPNPPPPGLQRLCRNLCVYQGVFLPVHVCFACACVYVRLGAYAGSGWI